MKMRSAGRVQRIGFAALALSLAFLACGAAMAADVERQIPVIRDTAGSGLTMEISREGSRQTATPFLTLNEPTVQRIDDRITKRVAGFAAKEIPSEASVAGSGRRVGLDGTPRKDSGRSEADLSSRLPVPEEITVRSMHGILKGLRASRKEKPAPDVVLTAPEERLGMADTSRR